MFVPSNQAPQVAQSMPYGHPKSGGAGVCDPKPGSVPGMPASSFINVPHRHKAGICHRADVHSPGQIEPARFIDERVRTGLQAHRPLPRPCRMSRGQAWSHPWAEVSVPPRQDTQGGVLFVFKCFTAIALSLGRGSEEPAIP